MVEHDLVRNVKFSSACSYLVLHAILIMVQATTLNVAFNSHNKSLLTIMMSNNVGIMHKHMHISQRCTQYSSSYW